MTIAQHTTQIENIIAELEERIELFRQQNRGRNAQFSSRKLVFAYRRYNQLVTI